MSTARNTRPPRRLLAKTKPPLAVANARGRTTVPFRAAAGPVESLENHPFFRGMDTGSARVLFDAAEILKFSADDVIFEENSEPDALFLVLDGRVNFFKTIPGHPRRLISSDVAGDFFGEIGVLTGAPRAVGAVSAGNITLARLPRAALREFLRRTTGPIDQLLQSIVNHLHHTTSQYIQDMLRQEKLVLVGNMVGSLIHDFKNPFTLISLGAQLMMQQHGDERTHGLCQNMIKQVERMVEMANEVSEFSKGIQTLKPVRVDARRLAERFRELNEPYFQRDNVKLEIATDHIAIEGEENKLLRVLQNLVGNALDALEERPGGKIRITFRDAGETAEICISDNGPGIPEHIRDKLFEPFVTHGKTRGTGLGTAIAKSIVEAHKGAIRFETATGQGTTFTITLPKSQAKS